MLRRSHVRKASAPVLIVILFACLRHSNLALILSSTSRRLRMLAMPWVFSKVSVSLYRDETPRPVQKDNDLMLPRTLVKYIRWVSTSDMRSISNRALLHLPKNPNIFSETRLTFAWVEPWTPTITRVYPHVWVLAFNLPASVAREHWQATPALGTPISNPVTYSSRRVRLILILYR